MPEEKQLTEQESLQLIGRMIHEAKGYYYESGLGGLIYGFSFFICSLLHYLMGKELIAFPFEPFYLLVPVFFAQAWLQWNEEKKKKAKTFTDEAVDYVWMGFFISALAAWCGAWRVCRFAVQHCHDHNLPDGLCSLCNGQPYQIPVSYHSRLYLLGTCHSFFFYARSWRVSIAGAGCCFGMDRSWVYLKRAFQKTTSLAWKKNKFRSRKACN
jgi:hypothetical protein